MGPLGAQEMIAVFVIALLLFGPKKLPELGRTLGKAISEFRRAKNELKATFETHLSDLEREVQLDKPSTYSSSSSTSTAEYPYPYDSAEYDAEYGAPYEAEPHTENYESSPPATNDREDSTEHKETSHESSGVVNTPVPGTVARSNGSRSIEASSIATEEEHHA